MSKRRITLDPFPADPRYPVLRGSVKHRVAFSEVDPMGIVWFGNYTFFFEKASAVLRDPLGLSHADFFRAGVQPPIVHYAVDYHRPSRLDEELTIEARLYGTDAARLNTGYRVIGPDGEIRITAQTIQVFIDAAGAVCCVPPRLWADCLERWRKGEFACLQA